MEKTNKFSFPTKTRIWWGSNTGNSSTIKDSEVAVDFDHKGFTVTFLAGVTPERNKTIYHPSKLNKQAHTKENQLHVQQHSYITECQKRTVDACRIQILWPGSPHIKPSYWFKFFKYFFPAPTESFLKASSIRKYFVKTVSKTDHQQQILREVCQFWMKFTFSLNVILP